MHIGKVVINQLIQVSLQYRNKIRRGNLQKTNFFTQAEGFAPLLLEQVKQHVSKAI